MNALARKERTWTRRRSGSIGFTLIEVMVALAIVAMALPAMLTLVMTQLDGTVAIREKTLAFWAAENELTRIRLQQRYYESLKLPDEDKGTVKMGGMQWYWEMRKENTSIDDFYRVDISIYAGGGIDESSGSSSPTATAKRNLANKEPMARLSGFISD